MRSRPLPIIYTTINVYKDFVSCLRNHASYMAEEKIASILLLSTTLISKPILDSENELKAYQ